MGVTKEQRIIRTVGAVLTLAALATGGKAVKDTIDFNNCVGKETKSQQKMRGTPELTDYVKSEVERICRSGKERR